MAFLSNYFGMHQPSVKHISNAPPPVVSMGGAKHPPPRFLFSKCGKNVFDVRNMLTHIFEHIVYINIYWGWGDVSEVNL